MGQKMVGTVKSSCQENGMVSTRIWEGEGQVSLVEVKGERMRFNRSLKGRIQLLFYSCSKYIVFYLTTLLS